jgi:cytidylate kinase
MQIICISRGSQSHGEEFAKLLASKLGYECLCREHLLEEATKRRIPIGKLETAIIKPHTFTEKLAIELEHYKALATSLLCEKALQGSIVYQGRTGHLLLPGIDHILKLRVVSEMEQRIQYVMQRLQLPRDKAKRYIEQVDDDRRRWVKTFYNVEWDVYTLYDMILNLSHVNINNAASAICNMAQLPEFQATPASTNALKDLYLASRAKLLLFSDRRTKELNVKIKAGSGVLHITYPGQQDKDVDNISEVLKGLSDAKELVFTKAQTNILWIQQEYKTDDSSYPEIISLANTWDAAVELLKITPGGAEVSEAPAEAKSEPSAETWRETGIIAEDESIDSTAAEDMSKVYEKLIKDGRAGGRRAVAGSQQHLLNSIDPAGNYKLIVFDNVFLDKGAAARKRLQQEWSNSLGEKLKTPVVNLNEIQYKYHFGARQLIKMIVTGVLTALIVFLVFTFSHQIITFLSNTDTKMRVIATITVLAFVPIFAFIYGTVAGLFLKMLKLE